MKRSSRRNCNNEFVGAVWTACGLNEAQFPKELQRAVVSAWSYTQVPQ